MQTLSIMNATTTIYLFKSRDSEDRYALSIDMTGCNMPRSLSGWFLRGELPSEDFPPEFGPALEHLIEHGFSILNIEDDI